MSNAKSSKVELKCERCGESFFAKACRVKRTNVRFCSWSCCKGTLASNYWKNVVKGVGEDDCWSWSGHSHKGYGRVCIDYKYKQAHRVSWELHFGPIPEGMLVCHKCDNPPCTNPKHLFIGSHLDNNDDKISKGRSAPQHGENNPSAKANAALIIKIFEMKKSGMRNCDISREVGLGQVVVCQILKRDRWKHVEIPDHLLPTRTHQL